MILAFSAGLLLALTASGGIAGERVTLGGLAFGLLANAAATLAAIVVASTTTRRRSTLAVLVPQVLGAVVGVALVHLVLRREALGAVPWLSERPAQLVNDAVAVAGLLVLAWAGARDLDLRLLVLAFLVVTAYRLTASMWHLDQAPGGFQATVQQLVVAQLVGAAIALAVWRSLLRRAPEGPS
ncbi:MAG TPA: hypothetical protein VGL81_17470 [Polyangiaceae bacterium]